MFARDSTGAGLRSTQGGRVMSLDLAILHFFNVTVQHPWLDKFWLIVTQLHKLSWFIYVIFPLIVAGLFFKFRMQAFKPLIMVGLAVGIADTLSYRVIKSLVHRDRPFQNEAIASSVRLVGDAHGPSFPSNHTANCFAGASILGFYFRRRRHLFYNFALVVGLSRIALGGHFPSDVLAGAVLGLWVGWLLRVSVLNHVRWLSLSPHSFQD